MDLSQKLNGVHMEPQVKSRSLRNIVTGKITSQSTNKTKRLLKTGFYVEVMPEGSVQQPLKVQANALPKAKVGATRFWLAVACGSLAVVAFGIALFIR